MGNVQGLPNIAAITDEEEFRQKSAQIHKDTVDEINGRLEFDKNMATETVAVTFPAANTDVAVRHNLDKVGVHYLKAKASAACHVFDGSKASSKNTIYLRCDQIAKVTLILY